MTARTERDALGEKQIPAEVYWGIHTERARENFSFSRLATPENLIRALAQVKKACAQANTEVGALDPLLGKNIEQACDEIIRGDHKGQFPVDGLQGGAGTSANMNLNEVIAHRANELMGGHRGDTHPIHPIEQVNRHQSTNDVYPTAVKVAALYGFRSLSQSIESLQGSFQKKEKEFANVVKLGRTEMQGAVPITLGAEFSAFAEAVARDRWRTSKCEERLRVVNLGGTAVGTGLTAPRKYIFLATDKLREITGLGLSRSENLVDATANADVFVEVSGILKAHATTLVKICEDLRKMNLLGEILLEPLQVGSSIMPGKVNPVLLESGIQIGLKVMANDFLVTEAVSRGTFQISEFLPLVALALLESLEILTAFDGRLAVHVRALRACPDLCRAELEKQPTLLTAFLPILGYKKAEALVGEWERSEEKNVRSFLETRLGKEMVDRTLSPEHLMSLGYSHG